MSALGLACVDIIVVLAVVIALLVHLVLDGLGVAVVQPGRINVSWGTGLVGLDADYFVLDNVSVVEVVKGVGVS